MAQERLSSLALMHIHYDTEVDLDEVVTIFSEKNPRRMQLTNILCDWRLGLYNINNLRPLFLNLDISLLPAIR